MKKVIRFSAFETNSSSTHCIVILSKEDMERWKRGGYYVTDSFAYNYYSDDVDHPPVTGKLYTKDQAIDYIKHGRWYDPNEVNQYETEDDWLYDEGFISYDCWECRELEEDETEFTTPSGDEMIALCKYGYE